MLLMNLAPLLLALASFQEPGPQTPGPLMWTGEFDAKNPPALQEKPRAEWAEAHSGGLRNGLVALKTATELKRDFAQQLPQLDDLRARACWQFDYPQKAEIAVEIACVRADWLEKLGRHEDAVFAAWHPFVMPGEQNRAPYDCFVWAPSNGKLAGLVNRASELPALVELHKRFPSGVTSKQTEDPIDEMVRRECLTGNPQNLYGFGSRCVPGLLRLLREDPKRLREAYPSVEQTNHPLGVLMTLDRASANSLLLSTLGKRDVEWTMRAIYCLSSLMITKQGLVPSPDPYSPNTSSDSLTLQVVDALAREGMPAPRLFSLLEPLVGNDIVSPAVREFLLHQVQATDPNILSPLRSMLDGVRVGPNKRVLYEAYLDSPDSDLRTRCATALASYDVGAATLRATEHADANVRQGALRALVRHVAWRFDYAHNTLQNDGPRPWVEVQRTPPIAAALKKLARDPEKRVRLALVEALREADEEPAAELLELLLADADRDVRTSLAADWSGQLAVQARMLERLAGDTDPGVLYGVGSELARCRGQKVWQFKLDLLTPALSKLLLNPAAVFGERELSVVAGLLQLALQDTDGARVVLEACSRGPHSAELLPVLARQATWARNGVTPKAVYDVLDAASIAQLFVAACEHPGKFEVADQLPRTVAEFTRSGVLDARPFLELARDEQRPTLLRLRALVVGAAKDDPAVLPVVSSLLRSAKPEDLVPNTTPWARLQDVVNRWSGFAAARGALCEDATVPDALALLVLTMNSTAPALDATATQACLERWARLDEAWKVRNVSAFLFLDPRTDPRVLEQWKALYRDGRYTWAITDAMARFPIDESVPMLAAMVRAEWLNHQQGIENVRDTAISALTKRLDDLGADALLQAIATAPSEEIRKKCFDGLEQIRKYQDEKQNWQTRKNGQAARDAAVAELLPMLEDANPATRAAAARSLATLRASEHLPKLVRLLKDKDASVRDAAQKALDALNEPEAKKP